MDTVPDVPKATVMFLHDAMGLMVSTTVIVALQLDELLAPSFAVKITVFAPIFEQVNVLSLSMKEVMPQLSVEKLFTSEGSTTANPVELR